MAEIEKEWEETHLYGDLSTRLERAKRWLPYYAFLAEGASVGGDLTGLLHNEFTDRLIREKKLLPEDSVLDIGAGTGNYTIPMAAACREAAALDVSPESLRVLSSRAEALGLTNIRTVELPWEEYRPESPYDLVFSSMCTAICSTEELLRMESMAKRCCGIVTVMPGSRDSHRKAILSGLDIHPDGMIGDALTFYQILYHLGRYPETACRTVRYTTAFTRERFFAQYRAYLPIFGVREDIYLPYLERYWTENAVNGTLSETTELHLAMITWSVP